ncbi:MAG: hypothetical protein PVG38_02710 [Gammaproteobacteria bacterium]|jgi:hypothetical protein
MGVGRTVFGLVALLPATGLAAGSSVLLEQVEADHAALVAAESDFQSLRERGDLDAAARAEYAAYLRMLRERLAADCRALAQSGARAPAGIPCPEHGVGFKHGDPGARDVAPLSRRERADALDAELEAGLAEFDELLLREQQRVRAAAPRASSTGGGSAEAAGGASGAAAEAGAPGVEASGDVTADAGQGTTATGPPRGAGQGAKAATGGGGRPPDVPDGDDDDVVARQLREAAEKESDPELREKLWEEYRRYKRGTR